MSLTIPSNILPADGRFGSGPSKVLEASANEVAQRAKDWMGTSHRREPVREVVGRLRSSLTELFGLPDGYEILLGNGGSTVFWDAASFGLVKRRSQHLSFGEFSSKFAAVTQAAPHLDDPDVVVAEAGTCPSPRPPAEPVDALALTHNETSTGVVAPVLRPEWADAGVLSLVDATSAAGAIAWDPTQADCYYFAPQKAFASDGGLWIAACSPAAIDRIERLGTDPAQGTAGGGRWSPATLNLSIALANSRQNQTYNTPALATILMTVATAEWMLDGGGLSWGAARSVASSSTIYEWAAARDWCQPFVAKPEQRSPVVCTIDFDESISADDLAATLRANGIVDTESYRKLGRNQLRIASFPAIELADIQALCACIDFVVESSS